MGAILILITVWGVYQIFFGGEKNMSKLLKTTSLFFLILLWFMFILGLNSSLLNNSSNEILEFVFPGVVLVLFGIFLAPYLPKPVKGTPLYELIKGGIIFTVIFAIIIGLAVFFNH